MSRAVVLHRWSFQESSYIVEFFSETQGRVRAVAKGAKSAKSKWRGLLEPFQLLHIDHVGKNDLQTLTQAELEHTFALKGNYLYSGFYLNELLQRLLPERFAAPQLFEDYLNTLNLLAEQVLLEPVLRKFEWQLLKGLELDFSFTHEAFEQQQIEVNRYYRFIPEHGFVAVTDTVLETDFLGEELVAQETLKFSNHNQLKRYKQLIRFPFQHYQGNKPLHSRNLFKVKESDN